MTAEEEKQNNKKTFALIVAIVLVAMILIIGGVIGYLYLSSKQNIPDSQTTEHKDTTEHKEHIAEHTDTTHTAEHKENEHTDTTHTVEHKEDEHKTENIDTNQVNAHKEDEHKTTDEHTKTKNVAEHKIAPKEKPITTTKTTNKIKVEQPKIQHKAEDKGSLYTIQIYSSPVKTDAEKHLSMLLQKGVTGYITQQDIKGQIWYRVRFGNYEKYDDAKYIVEKLSLKDAWIERVK